MDFKQIIIDFPKQFRFNPDIHNHLFLRHKNFNQVLVCGMGGSALLGEIFYYFKLHKFRLFSLNIPIFTHRSYGLPPDIDENTLIICVSYSGNTEETMSAYQEAKEKSLEIAGITCGGELKKLLEENKRPWIEILDKQIPPRMSLGYQMLALVRIFIAYGLLSADALHLLNDFAVKMKPSAMEETAKLLAEKIGDKIPIIYASEENKNLARLWKIKFNENAKIPSFFNVFPELNHNEMNGWLKYADRFHFIFLSDEDDFPRIQKRFNATKLIIEELGGQVENLTIQGETPLEKMIWSWLFSDWLSYYLAVNHQTDPIPVELVEKFKKELGPAPF